MGKYKKDTQDYIDSVLNDDISDINLSEYIAYELDKQNRRDKRRQNKIKKKRSKKDRLYEDDEWLKRLEERSINVGHSSFFYHFYMWERRWKLCLNG